MNSSLESGRQRVIYTPLWKESGFNLNRETLVGKQGCCAIIQGQMIIADGFYLTTNKDIHSVNADMSNSIAQNKCCTFVSEVCFQLSVDLTNALVVEWEQIPAAGFPEEWRAVRAAD